MSALLEKETTPELVKRLLGSVVRYRQLQHQPATEEREDVLETYRVLRQELQRRGVL